MESTAPSDSSDGGFTKHYELEVTQAREQLRVLREKMVQRIVQRVGDRFDGRAPSLRVHLDQWPPLDDPSKIQLENYVTKLVIMCLLDTATLLPIDVDTIHKRVRHTGKDMHAGPTHSLCCHGIHMT